MLQGEHSTFNKLPFVLKVFVLSIFGRFTHVHKLVLKTNYRLMQVKSMVNALSTFIKLPFVIKIFVLSIFEWQFYTGFTVHTALTLCRLEIPKQILLRTVKT